jgi:four helix bundle protein
MDLAEKVYNEVIKWDKFSLNTIGKQLVRSIDSVAVNLSEGFGRYHFKERKHFTYYSRGSLYESKIWITKARNRGLFDETKYLYLIKSIDDLGVRLNNFIHSIGSSGRTTRQ